MSQAFADLVPPTAPRFIPSHDGAEEEDGASAVSWAAILGGAVASAALMLILLALGAGAGLSSLSPLSRGEISPAAVGTGALVWVMVVELVASAIGGYIAGRLRTKWVGVHDHEVYFRDTAHGFLAWATSLVIATAFLTSAATTMVGGENRASDARGGVGVASVERYYIDRLFRTEQLNGIADSAARAESGAILMHAVRTRALPNDDAQYLAFTVAAHTGVSRADAEKRVSDAFAAAQQGVDAARKAAAHGLYWLFVALLIGAFAASWAATLGGRRRDHPHVHA